jgi:hypothetical protein
VHPPCTLSLPTLPDASLAVMAIPYTRPLSPDRSERTEMWLPSTTASAQCFGPPDPGAVGSSLVTNATAVPAALGSQASTTWYVPTSTISCEGGHKQQLVSCAVMAGGVVSATTTLDEHWLWLPFGSLAVQVTTVVPTGKNAGASLPKDVTLPQLSVALADASHVAMAGSLPLTPPAVLHSNVRGAGALHAGASQSRTDTVHPAATVSLPSLQSTPTVVLPTA